MLSIDAIPVLIIIRRVSGGVLTPQAFQHLVAPMLYRDVVVHNLISLFRDTRRASVPPGSPSHGIAKSCLLQHIRTLYIHEVPGTPLRPYEESWKAIWLAIVRLRMDFASRLVNAPCPLPVSPKASTCPSSRRTRAPTSISQYGTTRDGDVFDTPRPLPQLARIYATTNLFPADMHTIDPDLILNTFSVTLCGFNERWEIDPYCDTRQEAVPPRLTAVRHVSRKEAMIVHGVQNVLYFNKVEECVYHPDVPFDLKSVNETMLYLTVLLWPSLVLSHQCESDRSRASAQ